jgi:hypothetical protein
MSSIAKQAEQRVGFLKGTLDRLILRTLPEKGRRQLVVEESQWKQMADAAARVMWPAAEES